MIRRPKGILFDYGGTLVEEVAFDLRAGTNALLTRATSRPASATFDAIIDRANRVSREVSERRDRFQIETPWPSLTRLIYDFFDTRFDASMSELELAFWDASVITKPMPGARDALARLHDSGVRMGVVSNSSFGQHVIRHELSKHGLADHLAIVVVSAEYVVRKPNPLLFETAAALLGIDRKDIWFVGDRLDTDVAGARAAGMTAVWFNSGDTSIQHEADLVVPTWPAFMDEFERTV